MEITRVQKEQGVSLLKVVVGEADYKEAVEKMLHDYKRKANIPGFRPGMVPMGIVRKMYGKGVVAEQSYRTASNAVFEYLQKEQIDYIGDVIPAEEQGAFDFDNNTEFEFMFEIGEAPKYDVTLSTKDKLVYHKIKISKEMHKNFLDNFLRRFGKLVEVDKVKKDEALTVTLDNGDLRVEDAYVGLISMTDEERKPWIGKKVGYKTTININEMYSSPAQRAAMLHVKEEELASIKPEFELEITMIRQFANPEINEEFFKTAFPEGNITDKEGLDAFIDAQIEGEMVRECDYMFAATVRNFMLEKAALAMPTEFLKRWLYTINEGKFTMEDIEKDWAYFIVDYKWQLVRSYLMQKYNVQIEEADLLASAKGFAAYQFAMYGMNNVPEEQLEAFAKNILSQEEQGRRILDQVENEKTFAAVREVVSLKKKKISVEKFRELN